MKVVAVVQARMGSTRLPNKAMRRINGTPIIEFLLSRLCSCNLVDAIVLATSEDTRNAKLISHIQNLGYAWVRGSEDRVRKSD